MAHVHFAGSATHSLGAMRRTSAHHQQLRRRRLQKATLGCSFDASFSPGRTNGDSIITVQSCLKRALDDDCDRGQNNRKQDCICSKGQERVIEVLPQPRVGSRHQSKKREFLNQPPSNFSNDSISIYSAHSSITINNMESEIQYRRRSKTPVYFVGQLERKSVICALGCDRAQLLAEEYKAILPLRLKTSFVNHQHDDHLVTAYLPPPRKRLRKIKCQLSLRDLVKQHSQCAPSPSTPGSDVETLVGSLLCSPFDEEFEKGTYAHRPLLSRRTRSHDSDDEQSLPSLDVDGNTDIVLKICIELLTNALAAELLRHHATPKLTEAGTKDRATGLQILLMIEAYETVQQQVRRMLYDKHVTGKQFEHVRDAERILEHWLQALYTVYDREHVEESARNRLEYEWPLRSLSNSERGSKR
ncbi:uncharacterized protein RAG0_15227 [Rhynchosporium agropyri]|uniref:Uncharacterized protein n=1 Tax=Rhynchosporium agropyri TaxID=914238 RepID=A0A1E1LM68_9HELO|nr:uncharacterized protein RAG0_15227 [Rhynchosporium agropyri]